MYVVKADYRQDALDQHNDFRRIHDAPSMTLDDSMNAAAEEYAHKLFKLGYLKHSNRTTRPGQGENLYYGCSTAGEGRTVHDAVKGWYDEVCDFDFSDHSSRGDTGHFTQVVWKASTQLGIGKYTGKDGPWTCTYIVARYKPAGNNPDELEDNVLKGSFSSSQYCGTFGDRSLGEGEHLDIPEGSTGGGSTGD